MLIKILKKVILLHLKISKQIIAPNIEVTGAKKIFSRSIDNRKLRYVEMYSDRDSKTYSATKDTYVNSNDSNIEVQNKECVSHVQKKVGTRLIEEAEERG